MVLTAGLAAAGWAIAQTASFDPHGDAQHGVLRRLGDTSTRGQCIQCHPQHGDADAAHPEVLFAPNDNRLCFATDGASPCHAARPVNYPLDEGDRLPLGEPDRGYFEANAAGARRPGVELRGRWPGPRTFEDPMTFSDGKLVSPHAFDADMPRRDGGGEALCLNCHDPHATPGRDLLVARYGGIEGHGQSSAPSAYALCFRCHGRAGPGGMEPASRLVEDWYDSSLNGDHAGHQIRRNPRVALAWPAYVMVGDKLPCYDCHNPHGSAGNDLTRANANLISDQRPGWSELTMTWRDAPQARRFCFGCHVPSDGMPGSQTVEGIVMNAIPATEPEHASTGTRHCGDCHGNDRSSATAYNVHNPSSGGAAGVEDPWRRW
jgi:predicted CXXCH cytochrome family protein